MKSKFKVQELSYTAMGVALVAVCSWISIPLPVPVTMQTFAICLITAVLGLRLGLWTVVVYILLGAAGLCGPGGGAGGKALRQKAGGFGPLHGRGHSLVLCLRHGLVCAGIHPHQRGHRGDDGPGAVRVPLSAAGRGKDSAGRVPDGAAP